MEVEKMSRKYENQSCWWQKGEVPWTGSLFDEFILKEDSLKKRGFNICVMRLSKVLLASGV